MQGPRPLTERGMRYLADWSTCRRRLRRTHTRGHLRAVMITARRAEEHVAPGPCVRGAAHSPAAVAGACWWLGGGGVEAGQPRSEPRRCSEQRAASWLAGELVDRVSQHARAICLRDGEAGAKA
ncbi:hypothetical protein CC85DRAFT_100431 [Cutaneotrichosporon oleaginosum]|uniref:Uncharacterized protein n=1 Tax=Cutaneotrichosporon oleaginosum TaxID=879819 RepID=A0A0J0XLK8_9TREE|nr:uncharacterized protein CC85DRAFT_100431 [Cutaneotrichosporon oleaginosum]KLT41981.1 hypothetical protein CC85DRAFT_100431 [Cutaneotrichosporon oleaginosum]TXT14360.1 hypothetical protein COLE_00553 [Cutaneotrichosporon oleaginosum]